MKLHLIPLLILLFLSSVAQPVVQISGASKLPAKTSKFKVIGKNNDGIVLRLYGTEDVIDIFDNEMKLVTSKTIEFKNQNGLLQYIMLNKTGAVIFYLQQDRKYSVLYAQPVNAKFMEIGKPILIDSVLDRKDLVASNLRFKPSVDQSSLMIYYPFFSNGKVDVIKFMCLDRGLKMLYNKIIPAGRDERELEYSKSVIDNNGNAFLILKPEIKSSGSEYHVLHMSSDGQFSNYAITTEKETFGEPWFEIDNKNGNLVMTSFYDSKERDEDVANGFVYSSFDPANGTLIKVRYTPFSKEFIAELTGRENVTNQSLYTFNIRKSTLRNDGGSLIVAESFIKDTRETPVGVSIQPGFSNYRTSEIFQFNDIIAFSINSNGIMEWSSVMRKKQASEDDNGVYSSFLIVNEKDKLRFIYLDDISSSGVLNEYTLTSVGKSNRQTILNQEEKDMMLLPKMGKQVSPNEVIIPSYKNGALQLAKIIF
ncbi:MAG: hypothetical protein V4615_10435 [Bacteroidota bacterium]